MTAGQKALAVVTGVIIVFALVDVIGGHLLASAIRENRPILPAEEFAVRWHLAMVRDAPFILLPVLVGPFGVLAMWLVPELRPRLLGSAKSEARILVVWLAWLAAGPVIGVVVGVACALVGVRVTLPPTVLVLVFGVTGWAYTAALHRAFRLQSQRVADGSSRIGSGRFAALTALPMLTWPLGILVPLWAVWRAKQDTERAHEAA